MSKPSLDALFREQAGKQTDKWSSYPAVYEQVFSRHRDRAVRLLEIGVQNGGSLEVWARYFERAVRLVGCDIDPACRQLRYEDPRIAVVVGDAVTDAGQQQITAHSTRFDIVIDDGSHFSSDIIRAFCRYFPLLEPGGVYVVEDLHCSYWMEFEGGLRHPASAIAFFKALVDYLHRNHFGAAVAAEELLAPFLAQYGPLSLALDNLAAVEFFDSVCVVRKAEVPGEGVGRRVVRGGDSVVREGEATRDGEALAVPDQRANPFLRDPEPGHHDEQVQALRHRLAEAESETRRRIESCDRVLRLLSRSTAELDAASRDRDAALADLAAHREAVAQLRTSLSWRLTGPLRQAAALLARAPGALHFPASVLRFGGGARGSLALLGKVLREEGWTGVRWRLANAWQLSQLPVQGEGSEPGDYQLWLERYDTLDDAGRDALRAALAAFPRRPRLSVIMATYNTPLPLLDAAIRSVRDQLYPDWELCIADDASSDPAVRELLQRRAAEDERIRLTFRDRNGHISAASNSALALATGDFVVLLDHDDLLAETALYRVAEAINQHPDAQLVYSDEDKIDEAGRRYDPYFKSDFNPELMLAQNMISHLGVYRRELVQSLGGFREGYEGSQDYDLALRVLEQITPEQVIHIPRVLYH
ncbi:MAG TPA: glycosyltransferase, partial [Pseudohaliea sp.]|nr:glycosyltransferase [Pseudohaliea sp.]